MKSNFSLLSTLVGGKFKYYHFYELIPLIYRIIGIS